MTGLGVLHILSVAAPVAKNIVIAGACSVFWGWGGYVGFEWGVCLYLGLSFYREVLGSFPDELVQRSPVFCSWLPLGPTLFLVVGSG